MSYPCDIHNLNGCKLSCFDMTTLKGKTKHNFKKLSCDEQY